MKFLTALLFLAPFSYANTEKVHWDYWYTITIEGSVPYAYYNEKAVSKKPGHISLETHLWKKEEGFINEEHLGAHAKDNDELSPLFYNFYSKYKNFETKIDGSVEKGKILKIKVHRNQQSSPLIKQIIPKKSFFSSMFPIWLGKKLPIYKIGKRGALRTIPEDAIETQFATVHGQLTFSPEDEFAKKTKTRKIEILYGNKKSTWWVEPSGAALKILMQKGKTIVERTTKKKAQSFLLAK